MLLVGAGLVLTCQAQATGKTTGTGIARKAAAGAERGRPYGRTAMQVAVLETAPDASDQTQTAYVYILVPGDTLYGVSRRFGVSIQTIFALNALSGATGYSAGSQIRLPPYARDRGVDDHARGEGPFRVAAFDTQPGPSAEPVIAEPRAAGRTQDIAPAGNTPDTAPALPAPVVAPETTAKAPQASVPTPNAPASAETRTMPISNKLNSTGRAIPLSAPLMLGERTLGDVDMIVEPDDQIRISFDSLLRIMTPILSAERIQQAKTKRPADGLLSPADARELGMNVTWNPDTLELHADISAEDRKHTDLHILDQSYSRPGDGAAPAKVSAYLNTRVALNIDDNKGAVDDPSLDFDGALRAFGVVLEGEGAYRSLVTDGPKEFVREGARLVWDDPNRALRVSAGDLLPMGRGFQSLNPMGGISIFRSYQQLDPQKNIRPGGSRDFTLRRPSVVEARVNGITTARFQLDPGRYSLNDIPFVQGDNNVQLVVTDDLGVQEQIDFSLFFDRQLMAKGLNEFGLFVGAPDEASSSKLTYDWSDITTSGYFRRGFTDSLTAGANYQADKTSAMAGLEGLWASPVGSVGLDIGYSTRAGGADGYAINVGLSRTKTWASGRLTNFTLTYENRSLHFAPVGVLTATDNYAQEVSVIFSQQFLQGTSGAFNYRYSQGRGTTPSLQSAGLSLTRQLNDQIDVTAEARYEDTSLASGFGVHFGMTYRFGTRSSLRAETDTLDEYARLSYDTSGGRGVGAWTGNIDLEDQRNNPSLNGRFHYQGNRGEFDLSQTTPFSQGSTTGTTPLTSIRFASSVALADGHVGVGRPIYDSFVMAERHRSLEGTHVVVEPTQEGFEAETGRMGAAVYPTLSAYSTRSITYSAPDAPAGYDIGPGSVTVYPPYRSGYLVVAGSDYNITVIGRLLDDDGDPITLLGGEATELDVPNGKTVELFTNGQGRFGLSNVKKGRWRIDMPSSPAVSYTITIVDDKTLLTVGDLRPDKTGDQP